MTTAAQLSATLREALQWKEDVGLPALEKVEQLTIKLNYYINQELIYQSELEMLRNELNEKISFEANSICDRNEMVMEKESHLQELSIQSIYLEEQCDTIEYLNENSEALNLKIKLLQKRNKELEESNQKYIQINYRLIDQQVSCIKNISNQNKEIKKLKEELSIVVDMFHAKEHKYRSIAEKTILEQQGCIELANNDLYFCMNSKNIELDSNIDLLSFQRERTAVQFSDMDGELRVKNPFSAQSISSEEFLTPKIYNSRSVGNSVLASAQISIGYTSDTDFYFPANNRISNLKGKESIRSKVEGNDDEKKMEEEIEDINIYEILIEALNNKLSSCEKELYVVKDKFKQCEKSLFSMNMQYDNLYAEHQSIKDESGFYSLFYCAKHE